MKEEKRDRSMSLTGMRGRERRRVKGWWREVGEVVRGSRVESSKERETNEVNKSGGVGA